MSHKPPSLIERVVTFAILFFVGLLIADISAKKLIEIANKVPEQPPLQSMGSTITPTAPDPLDYEVTPDEPKQTTPVYPKTFSFKGYDMRELAHFEAHAVLLSKHAYSADDKTTPGNTEHRRVLSPYDFAIGWGPMSNPSVLKNFTYFQKDRFFFYAAFMDFLERSQGLHTDFHVANVHIIPGNDAVADALERVQPRDIVTIEGSLIEISFRKQVLWKSSLTRTDTGDGACEVLFLTKLTWTSRPPSTQEIPLPKLPELPAAISDEHRQGN